MCNVGLSVHVLCESMRCRLVGKACYGLPILRILCSIGKARNDFSREHQAQAVAGSDHDTVNADNLQWDII